ncbi:MAG: hypothetical protein A2612_01510 [Candidatus Moranbacteria bacterium RIFOXYD1_FULL_44_12]|nr:MAG: hypothetical protein A2612_01510 [Candidatus Moranbacteria bacterium RIFOXYD1_FULL_44_12]
MEAEKLLNKEKDKDWGEYEVLDFNKPSYRFIPSGHHDWRQQGSYLVCKSCELTHAVYIGINKEFRGYNDKDQPLLKKRY